MNNMPTASTKRARHSHVKTYLVASVIHTRSIRVSSPSKCRPLCAPENALLLQELVALTLTLHTALLKTAATADSSIIRAHSVPAASWTSHRHPDSEEIRRGASTLAIVVIVGDVEP